MTNQYDIIVIGAGKSNLTLSFGHPSPKRREECGAKNKAPVFAGALRN